MATVGNRDWHDGTTLVRGVFDPTRTSVVTPSWVTGIDNDLNNALRAVRNLLPKTRKVDGVEVPLQVLRADYRSADAAVVRAFYGISSSSQLSKNLTTYDMDTGVDSVQEYYTDAIVGGRPTQTVNVFRNADNGLLPTPYRYSFPTWELTIRTVLDRNVAGEIKRYLTHKMNSGTMSFGTFRLSTGQVRFDGARIVSVAPKVFPTMYRFSVAPFPWQDRVINGNDYVLVDKYAKTSFTSPGFPISGSILT